MTAPNPISLQICSWEQGQEDLSAVRVAVFVEEQNIPRQDEFDGKDETALHALVLLDGKSVGAARLTTQDKTGRIGRVAVLPEARKRGFGRDMVEALMEAGRKKGIATFILAAQLSAVAFYQTMGFVQQGETFMEDGIEHITMVSH